jgi:predicted DNA-binding transcriptional regulator AlpA
MTTAKPPAALAAAGDEDRIIWRADLAKFLGRTSETIRCYIRDGKLPTPDVKLSQKTMGWHRSTLAAFGIHLV